MTPPIAIIGAGPSGLVLGRLLEVAHFDFLIFERDEDPHALRQGGSLDIHTGTGQLALKEAGLLEQFKSLAQYDVPMTIADKEGTVAMQANGESNRPEIDRKALRSLLLSSIPESKICWRSRVERVVNADNGLVSIHFDDGRVKSGFKLVVGADGAWSKARTVLTSAHPEYSGFHYLSAVITPANPHHPKVMSLAGLGNYLALGSGKQIAAQRNGDASYTVYIGLSLPERWSRETDWLAKPSAFRQWLVDEWFVNWAQVNTDLIKHSEGEFRAWPLYAMPPDSLCWDSVPGITCIGDAAHVSTPFVGEGVNCAMHDSVQLAQQIVKFGLNDLAQAVVEYEKLMFPRAIDLITRSAESGRCLFAPDSPQSLLKLFGSDAISQPA